MPIDSSVTMYLWFCTFWCTHPNLQFFLISSKNIFHMLDDTSSVSPTIKLRWYRRDEVVSYVLVQYSHSYVWAVAVGVACSRSSAVVTMGPVDASEGEIHTAKNYVAGENWTQDLGSDKMLDDTSSTSPTIKSRWYRRGKGISYIIV
jgi:hypothetical protein